jgi:hypothetical protein
MPVTVSVSFFVVCRLSSILFFTPFLASAFFLFLKESLLAFVTVLLHADERSQKGKPAQFAERGKPLTS